MKSSRVASSQDQVTDVAVRESSARHFPANTVLMVVRSGILEHSFPVAVADVPGTMNQDLKGLHPAGDIDATYLAYGLRRYARDILRTCSKNGTTVASIATEALKSFQLPVAPIGVQRQVVSKLDQLFSDLDAGIAALERAKANLARYRAAVLKAAVEGRLTEEWRGTRWEGSLPSGWKVATVEDLAAPEANSLTDGPFGSNLKTSHYQDAGPRVVRLQNIGDGVFRDERAHISEAHYAKLTKHAIYEGDLVVAMLGTELPRACLVPAWLGPAIVKADCVRFAPDSTKVRADYASIALNSPPIRMQAQQLIRGVGRPRLSLGRFRQLKIPVPSLDEQLEIATLVSAHQAASQAALDAIRRTEERSAGLRSVVLGKAFSGELT